MALEDLPLEPLPLPGGVVRILDRQLGQRRGPPFPERFVEDAYLAPQDLPGPGVRSDMVEREEQDLLFITQAEQSRSEQAITREVEWAHRFFAHEARGDFLALPLPKIAQINVRQRNARVR